MAYILPNWKTLARPKWVKNKISQTKVARVHKRLLAILFDIDEITVSRQFSQKKLNLWNPYAVKKYIEERLERDWWLENKRKESHKDYLEKKYLMQ